MNYPALLAQGNSLKNFCVFLLDNLSLALSNFLAENACADEINLAVFNSGDVAGDS